METFVRALRDSQVARLSQLGGKKFSRSISTVEYKVAQAHFLLEQIAEAGGNFFAVQCFSDAFAAACRSITFAMQAVINVDGFAQWYNERQKALESDALCKFFNAYRVVSTHIGETVVSAGATAGFREGKLQMKYYFMPTPGLMSVPDEDVHTVCSTHFKNLLSLTFDALKHFKYQLDDQRYFTSENFAHARKGLGDALQELGFPPD